MEQLAQHLVNAMILGGTYALLGIGLTMIFGIMRVVNFTHGELYTFGAYMMFALTALLGLNFFVSIAVAILLGIVLGAVIEIMLLRPLRGADIDTTMLVMIGAWITMQNAEQFAWTGIAKSVDTPFPSDPLVIGGVSVAWARVFVFFTALALIGATYLLINRTKLGKAMRATFQDAETAALMGIRINRVYTITFALGSGLAAAAGALLGPIFVVTPTMGDIAALKAFAIVILGGLGNIVGATIGGFVLAFIEELGAGYISSGYRDAMGFLRHHLHPAPEAAGPVRAEGAHRVRYLPGALIVVFFASVPFWLGNLYFLHILITTGIFIIAAMSLNLLLGYTGQLSLGHVAFFGIGAYTSALVSLGFDLHITDGYTYVFDAQAGLVRRRLRHRRRRAVRLADRQDRIQGARGVFRHHHDQLRRGACGSCR